MSTTVTEKIKYEVTLNLNSDGIGCTVYRAQEDEDFIDVVVPYRDALVQLFDYNQIRGKLNASGVEEVLEVRDALEDVIFQLNKMVAEHRHVE